MVRRVSPVLFIFAHTSTIVTGFLLVPLRRRNGIRFSKPQDASSRWKQRRNDVLICSSSNELIQDSREAALQSLERLRTRQSEDLKETERLLKLLSKPLATSEDEWLERSLSAAKSVLRVTDYGFRSRSDGCTSFVEGSKPLLLDGKVYYEGPPGNLWQLGSEQFVRNWNAIKGEYNDEEDVEVTERQKELQTKLNDLTLNSTAIWERELEDGPIRAPIIVKVPYLAICYLLDVIFEGRNSFERFFLLETVARMPYFSYITMLHLYETLGFWRRSAEMKRIHFAEEINEFHHLLIMESLGGDQSWWVRFLAQHSAIVYYVVLCVLWAVSPSLSYRFSELLETHAVNTYGVFVDENAAALKTLPPSVAAIEYYSFGTSDPFYAEFQTAALADGRAIRRPGDRMLSLYDVFSAIRGDEADHAATMHACLDPGVALSSPSLERRVLTGASMLTVAASTLASSTDSVLSGIGLREAIAGSGASIESVQQAITALLDALTNGPV